MNTMKNAVQEFINNFSFSDNYRFLQEHYSKGGNFSRLFEEFLGDNALLSEIDLNAEISQDIIYEIENYDNLGEFIDGAIDIYYTDLTGSIELFWEWIEDFGDKDNFYKNIAIGQFLAYSEALHELQREFVEYLESQI